MPPTRLAAAAALALAAAVAARQPDPADQLLNAARKAYSEKNYPAAAQRFREFAQKHGGHREANAARFGLGLALLDAPERDFQAAAEALHPPAGDRNFADRPRALYYLAVAHRGLGLREAEQAAAKPNEAQQRRQAANGRFGEAANFFAEAAKAFADAEWRARALADRAEVELRGGRFKECRQTTEPFLKDAALKDSRSRPLGLYYHGVAAFQAGELPAAARALNAAAVLDDPVVGTHARSLMGQVFRQSGEFEEARLLFESVPAEHDKHKRAAAEALKRPDADPADRPRLERLANGPPPDHVAEAVYILGCLAYQGGRFADAAARFGDFLKQHPNSPRAPEARLQVGFCQVQQKQFAEAAGTLTPLVNEQPRLADQALLWLGKAQAGAGDAKAAVGTLKQAADRAKQLADAGDKDAWVRRAECLVEMADAQQLAGQHREAAQVYESVRNEKALPQRSEELLLRQVEAAHLGGDCRRSDDLCEQFGREYPQSTLAAAVLFRRAENAYFQAAGYEKKEPNRKDDIARHYDEAERRYQAVAAKYPEFERVNLARYGAALAALRRGDFERAAKAFGEIPVADRTGELALAGYLQADCLLRLAPAKADDALAAGKLQEQLQAAAGLLDAFAGAAGNRPEVPDALVKLGQCHARVAQVLAPGPERNAAVEAARKAFERVTQQHGGHPLMPQAVLERAKVVALAGDKNGAANELRRFTNDPLKSAPVAPLAVVQLATLLREMNRAEEAVKLLDDCRKAHESALAGDPRRAEWLPLLRYHQGVCLMEAGKLGDARGLFEQVAQQSPNTPTGAEATLRGGQCRLTEARAKLDAARQKLAANPKPDQARPHLEAAEQALAALRETAAGLERRSNELSSALPDSEARARMLYDAAWAYRLVADEEVARERKRLAEQKKAADVPPAAVKPQPAEAKARAAYAALVTNFPEVALATDGRFELAELFAARGQFDDAAKLLAEAADKEPPAALNAKILLRLGDCLMAKKDFAGALPKFEAVLADPKSPLAAQAYYRAGECALALNDPARAAARLAVFRDLGPFQNLPGLSDKALVRLGVALAQQKQWDASRQAYEQVVGRFGGGPWAAEGHYGVGWAWQNQRQFDNAINAYKQAAAKSASELGARAQLQIGLCRLEQKRYAEAAAELLIVPDVYDFPHLTAAARCEAGRAYAENKQPEFARKVWERVVKEHPDTDWARAAKERIAGLK